MPFAGSESKELGTFVNLGDPDADSYIVRDVVEGGEGDSWRWTRKRPELRFALESVDNLTFKADFSLAEATIKETGPVTVSVFINGQLLGGVHCEKSGDQYFEKRVPAGMLRANATNLVALEVDKVYVAKADGAILGMILSRVGFAK
jgi:hypothetical protein